jgi:hypothetical protein
MLATTLNGNPVGYTIDVLRVLFGVPRKPGFHGAVRIPSDMDWWRL